MYQGIAIDLGAPALEVQNRGLFVSTANIQQATNTPDALGQVDYTATGFQTIPGCGAIPCMRAPMSMARIVSGQTDTQTLMEAFNLFHVLLNGYFPQIPMPVQGRAELRAVVDGVAHQIMAVEQPSEQSPVKQTRLSMRQVAI